MRKLEDGEKKPWNLLVIKRRCPCEQASGNLFMEWISISRVIIMQEPRSGDSPCSA